MGEQGSPALDRLIEAVLERGLVITPAGHSYTIRVAPPVEEETEDSRPEGRIGGLGG